MPSRPCEICTRDLQQRNNAALFLEWQRRLCCRRLGRCGRCCCRGPDRPAPRQLGPTVRAVDRSTLRRPLSDRLHEVDVRLRNPGRGLAARARDPGVDRRTRQPRQPVAPAIRAERGLVARKISGEAVTEVVGHGETPAVADSVISTHAQATSRALPTCQRSMYSSHAATHSVSVS